MTDITVVDTHVYVHRLKYNENHDELGRFTFSDGGGGRSGAAEAPGSYDVTSFVENLESGSSVSVPAEHVDDLMNSLSEKPAANLAKVTVKGEPNLYSRNLTGTPRAQMPQLPTDPDGIEAFTAHLLANGINGTPEMVDPRELVAMQNELNSAKVAGIYKAIEKGGGKLTGSGAGALIVSKDGGILDGHHRWAATAAYAIEHPGTKMEIIRTNADAKTLLKVSNEFKGIGHAGFDAGVKKGFGEKPTSPPPDNGRWLWIDGRWIRIISDADDE